MKGDNVTKQYYGRRLDGVDLYRYAVPNVRTEPKPMGNSQRKMRKNTGLTPIHDTTTSNGTGVWLCY